MNEKAPAITLMTINGIQADTAAIADGLYKIICDREQEAIVRPIMREVCHGIYAAAKRAAKMVV